MKINFLKYMNSSIIIITFIFISNEIISQTTILNIDWNNTVINISENAYGVNSPANFIPSYSSDELFMNNLQQITQKKGLIRLHGWGMIDENSPESWISNGEWDTTKIQQALAPLVQQGYEIMINIPSGPMGENDYQNPQQFAQFCADLVQIVNVDNSFNVTYWEIPNERESDFISPGLSVNDMAIFIQTASQAMKNIDSSIKVGGAATAWVNIDYLTQLVQLIPNIDFITCHTYAGDCTNSLAEIYNNAQEAIADLADLRQNINEISTPDYIPIFLTEYNLSYEGCPDIQTYKGAIYDAILMTQSIKSGIDATCYWNAAPYSDMSIVINDSLDENAYLFEKMNTFFEGEMVQSTTSDSSKVLIFATKNIINNHYSFCLINRTNLPQNISLQMSGIIPEFFNKYLWGINSSYFEDSISWSEINNGSFTLSPYSVIIFNGQPNIALNLKTFLQGPYDEVTQLMSDNLRFNGAIPLTEPFTALGFNHVKGGGESVEQSVLILSGDDAIVDWIFVELRDANSTSTIVATQSALLQRDGDIVDVDGTSAITFPNVNTAQVLVVLRHRNHLGVRALNSYATNQPIAIDFTDPATNLFGFQPLIELGSVRAMIAGDANNDGQINAVDKNIFWRIENGNPYNYINSKADFNMDGVVNPVDKNAYWRLNNSKIEQLD